MVDKGRYVEALRVEEEEVGRTEDQADKGRPGT